jgi:hypothetical protein
MQDNEPALLSPVDGERHITLVTRIRSERQTGSPRVRCATEPGVHRRWIVPDHPALVRFRPGALTLGARERPRPGMHPGALPSCFLLETRALPADAERVVHSVPLDAHDAPPSRAANGDRVRAEAVSHVLRPNDVLDRASRDLSEPAALGTGDHEPCVAASCGRAVTIGA